MLIDSSIRKRSANFALTSASRSASGGSTMKSMVFCSTPVTCAVLFLFCGNGDLVDVGVGHLVGAGILDGLEVRVAFHRQWSAALRPW